MESGKKSEEEKTILRSPLLYIGTKALIQPRGFAKNKGDTHYDPKNVQACSRVYN